VPQNKGVLYLRGFRGAYLADDNTFYADFPKKEPQERNIAHLNLTSRDSVPGPTIDSSSASQYGPFVVQIKPSKKEGSYWENVVMEVLDAKTMSPVWSHLFRKSARDILFHPEAER